MKRLGEIEADNLIKFRSVLADGYKQFKIHPRVDLAAADNDTRKRIFGIPKYPEPYPYKGSRCDFLFSVCDTELILEKELLRWNDLSCFLILAGG